MTQINRTEECRILAEETLSILETQAASLTSVILRCFRLARLLDSEDAENWFRAELRGYRTTAGVPADWAQFASWSGREASVNASGQQLYWTTPIEEIERELDIAIGDLQAFQMAPIALTDAAFADKQYWTQSAAQKMLSSITKLRQTKADLIRKNAHIVACVRGAIHDWLMQTVVELRYGAIVDTAFERRRADFDQLLMSEAPEIGTILASAYERADSTDKEEWSQALTSCRRAIKALADSLYPATAEEIDGHSLDDASYRNRLIQFAKDRLESTSQRAFFAAEIDSVINRVEALDSLASKGVHAEVDERDLELTIIYTYLLAGELLSLRPPEETEPIEASNGDVSDQAVLAKVEPPATEVTSKKKSAKPKTKQTPEE